MASTSLRCSSPAFLGPKIAVNEANCIPGRVQFRKLRVSASASCAYTAERPTSRISSPDSLYEVLGIQIGANFQEIKAAYRRLARVLHPDVAVNGGGDDGEFIKVHEAYATLSDPEKRADYDRILMFKGRRSINSSYAMPSSTASMGSSVTAGFSGYTRRTWETDQCW